MIIQIERAVSEDDCRRLMNLYDQYAQVTHIKDYTGHPVVYSHQLQNAPDADKIFPGLVQECLAEIRRSLKPAGPLYPETLILAAIGPGGCHSRHADNSRQTDEGDWVPNHTPQRDVSAIFYLNDGFDGGEIAFEHQELVVKPRRGLLVAFPSDRDHVHEVFPVRSGFRYTMPIWFTRQESFAMSWLSKEIASIASRS